MLGQHDALLEMTAQPRYWAARLTGEGARWTPGQHGEQPEMACPELWEPQCLQLAVLGSEVGPC